MKKYERIIDSNHYTLFMGDNKKIIPTLEQKPDIFFFSPNYNIGTRGPVKRTNRIHGGYDARSYRGVADYPDKMPEGEYQQSQVDILNLCAENLAENGCIVYVHKNRKRSKRSISPYLWIHKANLEVVDELVWNRKSTHNNGRTQPRDTSERVYILAKKNANVYYAPAHDKSLKNIESIIDIAPQRENIHNAAFPMELAELVLKYYCKPGGLVADVHSGSGTTMCAAQPLKLNFVGCEIVPKYFKLSVERFENHAGIISL